MKRHLMSWMSLLVAFGVLACGWLPVVQPTPTQEGTAVDNLCNRHNQEVRWDLSQDHLIAALGYPNEECWAGGDMLFIEDSRVEILLPDGLVIGPIDSPAVAVSRNGLERHLIGNILVKYTNYLTADEAYEWAMQLAEQYDLPSRNLDEWYAHAKANPTDPTSIGGFTQRRLSQDEYITVKISLSFDKERPYNLYVQVGWPYDLESNPKRLATPTP